MISEFNRRGEPNRLVKEWLEAADTDSLYTSVLTIGEIRFGVELLPPGKRRTQLEQWLDRRAGMVRRPNPAAQSCRLTSTFQIVGGCFAPRTNERATSLGC
ncbi:MAG: hypothetical protein ACLQOO_22230 [Terriglobia bacterium]